MTLYVIHILVGLFLVTFSPRGWGLTGLLIVLSAGLFLFAIDGEIVPALHATKKLSDSLLIQSIYAGTCLLFGIFHYAERTPSDADYPMGSDGANTQARILSVMAFLHGVVFIALWHPTIPVIGELAKAYGKLYHTNTMYVLMTLQVVFLAKGILHGLGQIPTVFRRLRSHVGSHSIIHKIIQGPRP